jgi:hypothetical protein
MLIGKPQLLNGPRNGVQVRLLGFLILDDIDMLLNPKASLVAQGIPHCFTCWKDKLIAKVAGKSDGVLKLLAKKGFEPKTNSEV